MGKVPDIKRLSVEDFSKEEDKALIRKIAGPINTFFEQTQNIFKKNINMDNLNQEIISLTVEVDASGIPVPNSLSIRTQISGTVQGMYCIYAKNQTDSSALTSAPFLTYTQSSTNNKILNISHIVGLTSGDKWLLKFIVVGS